MNESGQADRHSLESGVPCVKHGCVKCCIETTMPLSHRDIKRISKVGYQPEDFVIKTDSGLRLKNHLGRCVFLSEDGCKIYPHRPEGCRLYPLVYDEDLGRAILDYFCPYNYEFEVRKEDIKRLKALLEKLKS